MSATAWDRISARLMVTDQCWFWLGSKSTKGYGQIKVDGRHAMVHRLSYEHHHGRIPDGMVIDHTCHDPEVCVGGTCIHRLCVNPAHLEATTNAANLSRQSPKAKTHCLRGHAYDDENTGYADGRRYCKTCRHGARARRRARYAEGSTPAKVRQWATEQGLIVTKRGLIAQTVIDAYEAAHNHQAAS